MKNTYVFMAVLLLFSCSGDQVSPKTDVPPYSVQELLTTVCDICVDDLSIASCTCGGSFGNSSSGNVSKWYPAVTAPICPDATAINITLNAYEAPNYFKISYLDKNGGLVYQWNSDWMGYLDFPGPWGMFPPLPRNGQPSPMNAPTYNTTAQTTPWPCPYVLPGTSEVFTYTNNTIPLQPGSPVNGVTWSILSNTPPGSISFTNSGALTQSVGFASNFSSMQIQATTTDPPSGLFQNCQTNITVSAPVLSNIASVQLDVWTIGHPTLTDRWDASVTCIRNTSRTSCPECP